MGSVWSSFELGFEVCTAAIIYKHARRVHKKTKELNISLTTCLAHLLFLVVHAQERVEHRFHPAHNIHIV